MCVKSISLALVLVAGRTLGQTENGSLTLRDALERARQSAVIAAADAGVAAAEANLRAESRLFHDNPDLEIDAGPRRSPARTSMQHTESIEQALAIGGRRGARIARARADLAASTAERDVLVQEYLRDVALTYIDAADAGARVRLAQENEAVARELLHIAERRYAAGDIPILDVNVAKAALSQARSDLLLAEGAEERALASLKARLGMPRTALLTTPPDSVSGIPALELSQLVERAATNPEVRRLEAAVRQAEADLRVARAMSWPDLAIRAEESKEEESRILLGGVRVSLPVFNRGQGERATATAQLHHAQLELDIARRNAVADVSGVYGQYLRQRAAADELRLNAIPLLADNIHLTERSYEVGEIDLADVLTLRREALDVRTRYLDRLRDSAQTAIDLESRAGLLTK